MKKLLLYIACATAMLSFSTSYGQRTCSSHEHFMQQLKEDPSFAAEHTKIENITRDYITRGSANNLAPQLFAGTPLYTIPVVVHVVYNTAAQNVSDAQIQSQIDVLNKDYQLLNTDNTSVPSAFASLKADCKIQFCLAKRDPSGNATTGIIRKSTTKTSFTDNDNVKKSAKGGDDAWPANSYLNLWVCNLGGGLLGYAQFPGGAAATDGVVITYTGFGTTGTATAPYNLGRSATHEVGHWLNLYHIWGDDGTACTGSDQVDDTPNQADENYGCPSFPSVSCSNGPNGDMWMNYMDYTDDPCMYMFTLGQRARMWALFQAGGSRAALVSSQGCSAPSGGGTCAVPAPTAGTITQTGAIISWAAVTGAVTYDLQYKTSAAGSYTTVSGIATTSYTLSGLTENTVYNYQVRTNCSGSSSAYSTTASFTTLAASTCTDVYETNNTLATAKAMPVNTAITALIGTSTDKDYFSFANTSAAKNIKVSLTNLPFDYDLKLYNPSGTLVGSSVKSGTTSESITYNTSTVGTYKVYVYGYSSAYSATKCYTLQASISAGTFRLAAEASSTITKDGVQVFPQPASGVANLVFNGDWKGAANVVISNQLGMNMRSIKLNIENNNAKLDISSLKPGMYYIRVSNGEQSVMHKLMVQR